MKKDQGEEVESLQRDLVVRMDVQAAEGTRQPETTVLIQKSMKDQIERSNGQTPDRIENQEIKSKTRIEDDIMIVHL
jgi:hypothetical protein